MKVSSIDSRQGLTFAVKNKAQEQKVNNSQVSMPVKNHSDIGFAGAHNVAAINAMKVHRSTPAAVINFGGTKNKDQVLFVAAEHYQQVGGVATVVKDFETFTSDDKEMIWSPYHNGKIEYDKKGNATDKVSVLQKDGKFYYTPEDLTKISFDDVLSNPKKKKFELEEVVAPKKMQFAEDDVEIALYKVKNSKNHFMVFTNSTARMPKPYAPMAGGGGGGQYASSGGQYSSEGTALASSWKGDPYAQFNKAVVELLPAVEEKYNFAPETVICNDAQTAFVPEYMAQKNKAGDAYYQGVKPTYVNHNMGQGTYTGPTSYQNLAASFMTKEQIEATKKDSELIQKAIEGKSEEYFEKFFPSMTQAAKDAGEKSKEAANATLIPLIHCKNGYVGAMTTVAETYADALAKNPRKTPPVIHKLWSELFNLKKVRGILNPFNNPDFTIHKPMPGQPGYTAVQEATNTITGQKETFQPFAVLKNDATYDEFKAVKNENKKNLFKRLGEGFVNSPERAAIIAGDSGRGLSHVYGHIDQKWTDKINNGEDVKLFVSWGRGDFQKGIDTVLEGFEKFAQKEGSENSVLVLGGALNASPEEGEKIKTILKRITENDKLKGRVAYIDGFAPGAPLASAGDAAIFASRFEPCGLTDLEAQRFYCTPIVTNTDGLAQKNPDPRIPEEKDFAISFKTTDEFDMSEETLHTKNPEFKATYGKMLDAEKASLKLKGVKEENLDALEGTAEADLKAKGINEPRIHVLAESNVKGTKEFKQLDREARDKVISDQISEAMRYKATQTNTPKGLQEAMDMYKNQKVLDTTWGGNGKLHPASDNGKSTRQIYQETHLDPTPQKASETMFKFDQEIVNKYKNVRDSVANSAGSGKATSENKTGWFKDLTKSTGGKIGVAAAGLAILGGIALAASKSSKKASTNAHGDSFSKNSGNVYMSKMGAANKSKKKQKAAAQSA
jgi:hypothetical protein